MSSLKLISNSKGVTHLIAILAVIVIAVVGAAGYYVISQNKDKTEHTSDQTASSSTFESKSDVEQASKALDDGQNDTDLDPAQLDTDLNDLL